MKCFWELWMKRAMHHQWILKKRPDGRWTLSSLSFWKTEPQPNKAPEVQNLTGRWKWGHNKNFWGCLNSWQQLFLPDQFGKMASFLISARGTQFSPIQLLGYMSVLLHGLFFFFIPGHFLPSKLTHPTIFNIWQPLQTSLSGCRNIPVHWPN